MMHITLLLLTGVCGATQGQAAVHLADMSPPQILEAVTQRTHRRPGTDEGRAIETWLAQAFESIGCAVTRQSVTVNAWRSEEASLVVDGKSITCAPMPFCPFADRVAGRLVFAGTGENAVGADVKGAVVLAEQRYPELPVEQMWKLHLPGSTSKEPEAGEIAYWMNARGLKPGEAKALGAVGLIHILVDQPGDNPSRYWPFQGPFDGVPTLYVSRRTGDELKKAAAAGAHAEIVFRGALAKRPSDNIIAELEGATDRVFVFQTHHDAPFQGAIEDGSGLVCVLELAKYYATLPKEQRPGRLVFACTTGHFDGAVGVRALAAERLAPMKERIVASFTMEHIGARRVKVRDGQLVPKDELQFRAVFVPESPALRDAVRKAFEEVPVPGTLVVPSKSEAFPVPPGESSRLLDVGIPAIQFISAPPYLLTNEDARDKVDMADLAKHVELVRHMVAALQ